MAYRESGASRDEAVQQLRVIRPDLSKAERQELASWIRSWETETPSPRHEPEHAPIPLGLTGELPTPTPSQGVLCKNCRSANPPEAKYCYACGHLLEIPSPAQTNQLYEEVEDPATFGKLSSLIIKIRGYEGQPLRLEIGHTPLLIGRSDERDNTFLPDIDLHPFDAKDKGVSRQHASIQRAKQTLTLIDQGSINHTFINGERVYPNEVRVIRDGDEIRFGHLVAQFIFQRELRRLS